jgi:23S rRNA pseudouridine2605 synthase
LRQGVEIDGRRTAPARIRLIESSRNATWLRFVIHEGRNRQIRRMCEAVGISVTRLVRVRVGPLLLGDLPPGRYRVLRQSEVAALRAAALTSASKPALNR